MNIHIHIPCRGGQRGGLRKWAEHKTTTTSATNYERIFPSQKLVLHFFFSPRRFCWKTIWPSHLTKEFMNCLENAASNDLAWVHFLFLMISTNSTGSSSGLSCTKSQNKTRTKLLKVKCGSLSKASWMNCRMQVVRVIQMIRVFLNAILFKMNLKRLRIWKTFRNADKDTNTK